MAQQVSQQEFSQMMDNYIMSQFGSLDRIQIVINKIDKTASKYNQKKVDYMYKQLLNGKNNYRWHIDKHNRELNDVQKEALEQLITKTDSLASQLGSIVSNELAPTYLEPITVEGGKKRRRKSRRSRRSRRCRRCRRSRK